ncbi:PEPxxWA-CTERM sorting domain-containing protein [Sphingomonas sp. BIUV-7]|uniref:PEPxxWA-CTERM sorting domain-containing protein n=1 Tax=Sphingomonas natans TaxID=3063330 RepID=A0ABT8Y423_9SPHN|nr:PEPxxWA-CTERM sorting domain-containing protein [Sphingomonas sp. BIUV-7]MDO6413065.1 PEPxxWA-CTERM sorting domain-containing protein [Sphingomonas sp. BIUV-7]
MRKILLALAALFAFAAPATAASYLFSVDLFDGSGVSQPAYSFTIDSNPVPAAFEAAPGFSYFRIANVAITADPAYSPAPASPVDLLFFDQLAGGAFSTADFVTISYFGTQLYSGSVEAPSFLAGTTDLYGFSGDVVGTISIAAANSAVPEPMTWVMMVGGMGMVGATLRRRRGAVVRFA